MAKTPKTKAAVPPGDLMIHVLIGPYRDRIIYAGEDYDQSLAEGWAIPAFTDQPTEIPDLDAKIELAGAMAAKWAESGGPVIAQVDPPEPPPLPAITGLTPNTAVAGGTDLPAVEANGSDFTPSSVVLFDGAAAPTTFVSDTQLTFPVAATSEAAARTAIVTIEGGTGSANFDFTAAARSRSR